MASIAQILAQSWADVPEQQERKRLIDAQVAGEGLRRAQERLTLERERVLHETERRKEQEAQRDALDDQTIQQARVQAQGDPDKFLKAISGVRPKLFIAEAEETRKMKKAIDDSDIAALDIANKEIERSAAELAGLAAFPEAEQAAIYEERFQRQIKAGQFPAKFDLKAINTLMGRAELGRKMAQLKIDQDRAKTDADTLAQRIAEYQKPKPTGKAADFEQTFYPGWLEEKGVKDTPSAKKDARMEFEKMPREASSKLLTPEEEEQQIRMRRTGRQSTEAEILRDQSLTPWVNALKLGQMTITAVPQAVRGRVLAEAQKQGIAIVSDAEREKMAQLGRAKPILQSVSELSERINTWNGIIAKARGGVERVKAQANLNDDLAEYNSLILGFTPLVARAVGHTGVLTEQDVRSVRELFPKPGDSKSLRDRKIARVERIMGGVQEATAKGILDPVERGAEAPKIRKFNPATGKLE